MKAKKLTRMHFFLKKGYSKELSIFLAEKYPNRGFGAGYLSDTDVEKAYQNWLDKTIKEFNKKDFLKSIK